MIRNLELKLLRKNILIMAFIGLLSTHAYAYLDADSLQYEKQREDASITAETDTDQPKKEAATTDASSKGSATAESSIEPSSEIKLDDTKESQSTSSAEIDEEFDDPYESYNRFMYSFNKNIDKYFIKPPAQLYAWLIPLPIKYMVTNFFENVQDIQVLANDLLQGEIKTGSQTLGRIVLNSTFGMFGLLDVAKDVGVHRRTNDFGVTFGKWGIEKSSYFVIPILGPSTLRDTIGTGVSIVTNPLYYYLPEDYAWGLTGLYLIDKRANLLSLEKIIDTVSDDEYVFVRNSYLSYRETLIRGEKPNLKQEAHEEELIEGIILDQDTSLNGALEDLDGPADNKSAVPGESSQTTPSEKPEAVVTPEVDANKPVELPQTQDRVEPVAP